MRIYCPQSDEHSHVSTFVKNIFGILHFLKTFFDLLGRELIKIEFVKDLFDLNPFLEGLFPIHTHFCFKELSKEFSNLLQFGRVRMVKNKVFKNSLLFFSAA